MSKKTKKFTYYHYLDYDPYFTRLQPQYVGSIDKKTLTDGEYIYLYNKFIKKVKRILQSKSNQDSSLESVMKKMTNFLDRELTSKEEHDIFALYKFDYSSNSNKINQKIKKIVRSIIKKQETEIKKLLDNTNLTQTQKNNWLRLSKLDTKLQFDILKKSLNNRKYGFFKNSIINLWKEISKLLISIEKTEIQNLETRSNINTFRGKVYDLLKIRIGEELLMKRKKNIKDYYEKLRKTKKNYRDNLFI